MKRFLLVLFLGLSLCNVSFADCTKKIDYEIETFSPEESERYLFVKYIFKNTSKDYIKIIETNIQTASRDIIIKKNTGYENRVIKPFGETSIKYIKPLEGYNKDLVKYFGYKCDYSTETSYNKALKKNTGYESESSISPELWTVILVLGFGIVIWILASRGKAIGTKEKNINKTKTETKTQSANERISEIVKQDSSFTRKITRLNKLYKSGTLTKAEFEKAKEKLLK